MTEDPRQPPPERPEDEAGTGWSPVPPEDPAPPPAKPGGLSSGDPLGGGPDPAPSPPPGPGLGAAGASPAPPTPPPPEAPGGAQPAPGYGGPVPPGAYGGQPAAPAVAPPAGGYMLAGWWRRVGATAIDGLIVSVGAIIILLIFSAVFGGAGFIGGEETGVAGLIVGLLLATLAIVIVALLYAPLIMARTNGQTPGRMAVGIRVVRTNGQPMDFAWSALREVAVKALAVGIAGSVTFGLAYLIDVLWPLWDDENRALHDFVVQTRVVRA